MFVRVSFRGQDRTLRTFRSWFDSTYPYHPAIVQWTGRGAANAEIPVRPRMAGPSFHGRFRQRCGGHVVAGGVDWLDAPDPDLRWRATGEAPDCRSGLGGSDSRSPRHGAVF